MTQIMRRIIFYIANHKYLSFKVYLYQLFPIWQPMLQSSDGVIINFRHSFLQSPFIHLMMYFDVFVPTHQTHVSKENPVPNYHPY